MTEENERNASQLGELESEVMKVLWVKERATVQGVQKRLDWQKPLAYTTVMTVLTRLVEKGFLGREKEGRGYIYYPLVQRDQIANSALQTVVNRFFDGLGSQVVANLLSDDETLDDDDLDALEELIRRKREERRQDV